MRKMILLAGILSMVSLTAEAADNGIYVGASFGKASIEQRKDFVDDIDTTRVEFDSNDMGYKLLIGVRPLDWLGVEGAYTNFGNQQDTLRRTLASTNTTVREDGEFQGYGLSGFLVGYVPIGPVDLFGKAGIVSWDTKTKVEDEANWLRKDGNDLAYGVGVQFRLLSLGLRAEYEIFDLDGIEDANLLSIGVTYTFL